MERKRKRETAVRAPALAESQVPSDGRVARDPRVIVVLERACLETGKVSKEHVLLNCDDHNNFLRKSFRLSRGGKLATYATARLPPPALHSELRPQTRPLREGHPVLPPRVRRRRKHRRRGELNHHGP